MPHRRIAITQDTIDTSVRANSSHCMIADAIKHALPGVKRVSVDLQTIRYTIGSERFVFFTPRSAQLALVKFDQGDEDIVPFTFALGNPAQVIKTNPVRTPDPKRQAAAQKARAAKEKMRLKGGTVEKHGTTKLGGRLPPTFAVESNLGNRRVFGLKAARA